MIVYQHSPMEVTVYSLIRSFQVRDLLIAEAPPALLSLLTAEFLYKFHSFTLECGAFLATWFLISSAYAWVLRACGVRLRPKTA